MADWNDESKWSQNIDLITRFVCGMLDKARSIESTKALRKTDPRAVARVLTESMLETVGGFEPVADLQEAMFAAMEVGDAERAGNLGVLLGMFQGMVIGATVEPENQAYELSELRKKLAASGGSKGKLTDADVDFAQTVVNDFCRGTSNSFSAACMRAKKKLKDDRNVEISDRRLRDILADPTI